MTGLESAIRNALDRAGAADSATRERIYRSARAALEKGLAQRPDLDPEAAAAQRRRFEALVSEIEEGERQRLAAGPAADARRDQPLESGGIPPVDADPAATERADIPDVSVSAESRFDAAPMPVPKRSPPPEEAVSGEVDAERTRRGRKAAAKQAKRERRERRRTGGGVLSTLFLLATLLAFGGLALWIIDASGLLDEGAGPGSFSSFNRENAQGAGLMAGGGFKGDWIPVFKAGEDTPPAAGAAATVEPVKDERGEAVRVTSSTNGPDGNVRIAFPAEVMQRMAGNAWIIALNARAAGEPTQISVECAFGSLGDCGRQRMDVAVGITDIVFKVDLSKGTAPSQPGYLVLNSDVSGQGKAIDLYAVGLHPAD